MELTEDRYWQELNRVEQLLTEKNGRTELKILQNIRAESQKIFARAPDRFSPWVVIYKIRGFYGQLQRLNIPGFPMDAIEKFLGAKQT
jgi:hypothetical protein